MPTFVPAASAAPGPASSRQHARHPARRLPLALLLCLPLLAAGCASPIDPATAREIPEEVRRAVRQSVDQGYRTGVVVGLVNPQGVYTFAYPSAAQVVPGEAARGEVVTPGSVFAVGSLTKVFTGIVLADMVERGEVELEGPLNRYLPAGLEIPARDGVELTLAHLATHTSGLPKEAPGWDWRSTGPADAIVHFARDYGYPRAYGAAYEYSNLGMALLGRVLEVRAGKPLADLVHERVAGPLGLGETGYALSPEASSRLATPHRGAEALPAGELAVPASAHAAGGLYSTAEDLLAFVAANLEAAAGESASGLGAGLRRSWVPRARTDEAELAMGLGWKIYQQGERALVHHGGQSAGHQAFIGFDAREGYGVVLLAASRSDDDLDRVALHLLSPRVPLPDFSLPPEVTLSPEVLTAHAGLYRIEGGNGVELTVEEGRLVYVETTPAGKHVRTTALRAESETHFTIPGLPVGVEAQRRDGRTVALALRVDDGEEFLARRVE